MSYADSVWNHTLTNTHARKTHVCVHVYYVLPRIESRNIHISPQTKCTHACEWNFMNRCDMLIFDKPSPSHLQRNVIVFQNPKTLERTSGLSFMRLRPVIERERESEREKDLLQHTMYCILHCIYMCT
jgi:hypothetical protein